jgi:hypothetical protein
MGFARFLRQIAAGKLVLVAFDAVIAAFG